MLREDGYDKQGDVYPNGPTVAVDLGTALNIIRDRPRIVVTGPQRSGTTIGARILAAELGYSYVDEDEIDVDNPGKLAGVIRRDHFVLQAPGIVHMMPYIKDAVFFVVMDRSIGDIVESQSRIMWPFEVYERHKIMAEATRQGIRVNVGPVSAMKYDFIRQLQLDNMVLLDYNSLASHKMWVPKDDRKFFKDRQYRVQT